MLFKLFSYKDGKGKYLYKDVLSTWNTRVRRICKECDILVVPHSVKFKKPAIYGGKAEAQTRKSFNEVTQANPDIINNFIRQHNLTKDELNKCFIGVIKLELADENFKTIYNKLKRLERELSSYENQIF